jgi:membrane fusion protein, macrolide-specific efflux system
MKVRSKWIAGALTGAVLLFALLTWWRMGNKDAAQDLMTTPVIRGDIEDAVSAVGSMQPLEFVDVGTQVSGQLKLLSVAVGDTVEKGAVLAEIDTAVLAAKVEAGQATLKSLGAQIDEKQAQHALATRQHKRNANMFAQDAVSRDAMETSQAAMQVTAAQVAALRAQRVQTAASLRIDEANLGYAKVLAPMAGTVVSLGARQGQTLNASQQAPTLLRLAKLDTMTVVTQVSEADVARLKNGTEVYFNTLGRPDRRWTGSVRQILPTPETVNNVVLYNVLFDVDNTDRQLMTQMSAQVFFVLARAKDVLLVPMSALSTKSVTKPGADAAVAVNTPPTQRSDTTDPATVAKDGAASVVERAVGDKKQSGRNKKETTKTPSTKSYFIRVVKDGVVEERSVLVGVKNRLSAQVVSGLSEAELVVTGATRDEKREAGSKDTSRRAAKL